MIQKCKELPLFLAFIGYEKAFDLIHLSSLKEALCWVGRKKGCRDIIVRLYDKAKSDVMVKRERYLK